MLKTKRDLQDTGKQRNIKKQKIEDLESSESKVDLRPKFLEPSQAKIDNSVQQKYINAFIEPYKPAAQWMVDNLQYISFDMLKAGIKACASTLNQKLKKIKNKDKLFYCVETGHSSEWIMNLASSQLEINPAQNNIIEFEALGEKIKFKAKTMRKKATYILFDDWSVSGSQLRSILEKFDKIFKSSSKCKVNLIFSVVFITNTALEFIQDYELSSNLKLTIIYANLLPTIYDKAINFCEDNNTDINEFLNKLDSALGNSLEAERQILAFSDWKTLDFASMPENFTEGVTPCNVSITGKNQINQFIPNTRSPYHRIECSTSDSSQENLDDAMGQMEVAKFNPLIKENMYLGNINAFFTNSSTKEHKVINVNIDQRLITKHR